MSTVIVGWGDWNNSKPATELPKVFYRRLISNFLLNFNASFHPNFKHLYSIAAKVFLGDVYDQIRECEKDSQGTVLSAGLFLNYFVEQNMCYLLLFVPFSEEHYERVLPTLFAVSKMGRRDLDSAKARLGF